MMRGDAILPPGRAGFKTVATLTLDKKYLPELRIRRRLFLDFSIMAVTWSARVAHAAAGGSHPITHTRQTFDAPKLLRRSSAYPQLIVIGGALDVCATLRV